MKDTRTHIIDIAEELIMTRGYNGFSYNDISEAVGIRKASIHYHFKTKADLASAVIRRYNDGFMNWCEKQKDKTTVEQFNAYGRLYQFISANATKICPILMLSTEFPTLPDIVQDEIKRFLTVEKRWLVALLTAGKENRELAHNFHPELLAEIIHASMEGVLTNARIFKNNTILPDINEELKKIIFR